MAAEVPRIGTRIRRARERMRPRMSQDRLAQLLGVSRSAINSWENDRTYPQSDIGALEEILGVDLTSAEPTRLAPAPETSTLPAHIQRRVDLWPPEDREWLMKVLTQQDDDSAGQAPG